MVDCSFSLQFYWREISRGNIDSPYDSGIYTSIHHRLAGVCPSAGALDFAWGRGLAVAIPLSGTLARRRRNSVGAFMLYPSPEGRYLVWAYLVTGIAFIDAVNTPVKEYGRCRKR